MWSLSLVILSNFPLCLPFSLATKKITPRHPTFLHLHPSLPERLFPAKKKKKKRSCSRSIHDFSFPFSRSPSKIPVSGSVGLPSKPSSEAISFYLVLTFLPKFHPTSPTSSGERDKYKGTKVVPMRVEEKGEQGRKEKKSNRRMNKMKRKEEGRRALWFLAPINKKKTALDQLVTHWYGLAGA